jgi:uncharacterized protein YukE
MPSGNSRLRVERTELENTGMTITSAASLMKESIADAARRIHALDANWEGMSNQNFMPEFNQSRTRAAAVVDGLTRLGGSLQEVGMTYEAADSVPIEFDMNISQDATGKVAMSYSFVDVGSGQETHVYNQFSHNGDGTLAVEMQEVGVSANGGVQMSHVSLAHENFNTGGYQPSENTNSTPPFAGNTAGPGAPTSANLNLFGVKPGESKLPLANQSVPANQQERLQERVAGAMGGLSGEQPRQSMEERIAGMNGEAGDVLQQLKDGELPTSAGSTSAPKLGGGGGSMPMQMPAMPPLQTPQSVSPQLLQSSQPPAGYGESGSLADRLMTAMAMDKLMDDSPLNRLGAGGGFSGNLPQGVGTMDLTDSMQTLRFPGDEVAGVAPDIAAGDTGQNPLEGIPQAYFEKPRQMKIGNINPHKAEKE